MGAYNNLDPRIGGLKQGLASRVESKVSAEVNGIDFGKPVFQYKGNDKDCFLYHKNRVTLTLNVAMSGVDTIYLTINADGAAVNTSVVTFTSNMTATALLIVAALEASFPDAIVTNTDPTTGLIYVIEIQDSYNRVGSGTTTGSGVTVAATYDTTMVFEGFAIFTQKSAAQRTDLSGNVIQAFPAKYNLGDAVNVMVNGWISVPTAAAVNSETPVYCVTSTSSAYQGYATGDSGNSNLALTGCTFKTTTVAAGLADIRVNL